MKFAFSVLLAAALTAACTDTQAPTGPTGAVPFVASLAPTSGTPGTEVTVTGSRFAATGNHVKFGAGYLRNLASPDSVTLRFVVPEGLDTCAPGATGPCPGSYPPVTPGNYEVVVLGLEGASNAITFTVTAR